VQMVQLTWSSPRGRSEARSMGFSFLQSGAKEFVSSTTGRLRQPDRHADQRRRQRRAALSGSPNVAFGIITNNGAFLGFLEALRNESLVKVLPQPKVIT